MDVQWQIKQNVTEANAFLADLNAWKKDVKKKGGAKKKKRAAGGGGDAAKAPSSSSAAPSTAPADGLLREVSTTRTTIPAATPEPADASGADAAPLPPIRGRADVKVRDLPGAEFRQPARQPRPQTDAKRRRRRKRKPKGADGTAARGATAAGHTYDYFKDKWDKFDVDAALREASESSESYETESEDEAPRPAPSDAAADNTPASDASPAEVAPTPLEWKDRGNAYFKEGQYLRAIECYTECLALEPENSVALSNRAMAHLKCDAHAAAADDCTAALALDPLSLKAYQRRATAAKAMGRYLEAASDFEEALRLSPASQMLRDERDAMLARVRAKEGLEPLQTTVHVPVIVINAPEEPKRKLTPTPEPVVAAPTAMAAPAEVAAASTPAPAPAASPARVVAPAPMGASGGMALEAPNSAVHFETMWKSCKGDTSKQWQVLALIPPGSVCGLLGHMLTGPLFLSIVRCALGKMADAGEEGKEGKEGKGEGEEGGGEHAVGLLEDMARAPRFVMLVLSVPGRDRAAVGALWKAQQEALPSPLSERMAALAPQYKIK